MHVITRRALSSSSSRSSPHTVFRNNYDDIPSPTRSFRRFSFQHRSASGRCFPRSDSPASSARPDQPLSSHEAFSPPYHSCSHTYPCISQSPRLHFIHFRLSTRFHLSRHFYTHRPARLLRRLVPYMYIPPIMVTTAFSPRKKP